MAKATSRCHSHRRRPRRSGRISRRNIRSTYGFARHNFLLGHFLLGAVGAALACIGVLSMGSHRAPFGAQVGAQVGLSQFPSIDESRTDGDVVGGLGLPDCSEAFERASHAHLRSCQRAEASDTERDERLCSVHRALVPFGPLIALECL